MKRRDFIKFLAASGLGAGMVPMLAQKGFADSIAGGPDRYLIVIGADGGWDTTAFFDPQGTAHGVNRVDIDPNLVTKNGIRWSAVPNIPTLEPAIQVRVADQFQRFFTTYDDNLTFVKGMDTLTISHKIGSRAKLTGRLGDTPGVSALYAATHGSTLPLSFLTFGSQYGGSDFTTGLNVTRASLTANGGIINDLASPTHGQSAEAYSVIERRHLARLHRQIAAENGSHGLELRAKKLEEMLGQRLQENLFHQLLDNMSQLDVASSVSPANFHWYPTVGNESGFKSQAKIAAAAIATGMSCTASLSLRGFDSHGNNDGRQFFLLGELVEGIHYLVNSLAFFGLADKTTIIVASDVGRTPGYNGVDGKDHFQYGGMMILHPKGSGYGGRVFGSNNELTIGLPIDLNTGEAHEFGTRLNVKHMMVAFNDHFGLAETARINNLNFDRSVLLPGVFA